MNFGPIFIRILYTIDCALIFHPNTIHYGFWPNFYPNTIHYGFWPNFHPNTKHYDPMVTSLMKSGLPV